ncbi:unnamed protein product [Meganyctiphanes norvegica]|uniref:Uroporphyrinogen-III synthase n=1 Tax=Meganyctiphanes norvegica TaxID=48144 RepID=A0AAV2QJ18_MEGNR
MSNVWLLKSGDDDGRYSDTLNRNGFSCHSIPALTFNFVNQGPLQNAFERPLDHSGLIFTSPRAVEAVGKIYSKIKVEYHHEWSTKKIFVVGEATAAAVSKELKMPTIGQESGNAQQLAPIIIRETKAFDKPLLFPCGNIKRDELPRLLANADRDFRALTCYETSQHPSLKSKIQDLISKGLRPNCIVFFSPSGVSYVLPILKSAGFDLTGMKIIAIGPATNSALVQSSIPVSGVCNTPSPEGLLHILKSPL